MCFNFLEKCTQNWSGVQYPLKYSHGMITRAIPPYQILKGIIYPHPMLFLPNDCKKRIPSED